MMARDAVLTKQPNTVLEDLRIPGARVVSLGTVGPK